MKMLSAEAELGHVAAQRVQALAASLARGVRGSRSKAGGVDALMLQFSLDSREGVALMCLAEALLRIPDSATRDRLIRDKIGRGDWEAHLGRSPSLFVNAAAWGLLITGRLVDTRAESALEQAVASMLRKGGEPLVRKGVDLAMRLLGRQFVTGRTIAEALHNASEREAQGYRFSFDMLGEGAVTDADAQKYLAAYEQAIDAIGRHAAGKGVIDGNGISVKLSAIHPRYVRSQRDRVLAELTPRLAALAKRARRYDIGINIDAEEADRLELSLDLLERLARDPELAGWNGIGFVVQAYQKRARAVIDWLVELARETNHRFMVRLVKGAYWDTEIKRAQVDGMTDYPVFTRKVHTDVSYLACAKAMLAAQDAIYPQFATHNAHTVAAIRTMAGAAQFEYQCLHGMGETLYDQIVGNSEWGHACRIYAPVGSHETLLAYLVRRLLENGANSSFVNRIVDPAVSIDELIADPVAAAIDDRGMPHAKLPIPRNLYPDRLNSEGCDWAAEATLREMQASLDATPATYSAAPMLAAGVVAAAPGAIEIPMRNPADRDDVVGTVIEATVADVDAAVRIAATDGAQWSHRPADARARLLERAADLLEENRATLIALAVREAGKTMANAIGEVREAADFCRYYAAQSRREFSGDGQQPIGPVVCIAPWNFPLAIFAGEVSAALAAGNPVLAKPAEQTPLMAAAVVRTFHAAGIPAAALQLLPGRGEIVGQALVADPRIHGVLFTGSNPVALSINRQLAARADAPALIAETGGQNAMIVDSSALPEQVVADAIVSAFDSAGQRCSALRILCVQRDVADRVVEMLEGALHELRIGDPRALATDVGPVIDAEARDALLAHVERMRAAGMRIVQAGLPAACGNGTFVPPTIIEIDRIDRLRSEVFGPVLHVHRYERDALPALIEAINATGYGLTHGIQSRIDETVDEIVSRIRAGNIYVNRNVIGAVVGVQPFGGEGLSGTGPKAGGPFYIRRLVRSGLPATITKDVATGIAVTGGTHSPAPLPGPLQSPVEELLPGPTGETNRWTVHPRGTVACVAPDAATLRAQVDAAVALGNRVLLQRSAAAREVAAEFAAEFPAGRIALVDELIEATPDAWLIAGEAANIHDWRQRIAARDGPIVPVIARDDAGGYDSERLVVERVVTVNTTASGGNAELLAVTA